MIQKQEKEEEIPEIKEQDMQMLKQSSTLGNKNADKKEMEEEKCLTNKKNALQQTQMKEKMEQEILERKQDTQHNKPFSQAQFSESEQIQIQDFMLLNPNLQFISSSQLRESLDKGFKVNESVLLGNPFEQTPRVVQNGIFQTPREISLLLSLQQQQVNNEKQIANSIQLNNDLFQFKNESYQNTANNNMPLHFKLNFEDNDSVNIQEINFKETLSDQFSNPTDKNIEASNSEAKKEDNVQQDLNQVSSQDKKENYQNEAKVNKQETSKISQADLIQTKIQQDAIVTHTMKPQNTQQNHQRQEENESHQSRSALEKEQNNEEQIDESQMKSLKKIQDISSQISQSIQSQRNIIKTELPEYIKELNFVIGSSRNFIEGEGIFQNQQNEQLQQSMFEEFATFDEVNKIQEKQQNIEQETYVLLYKQFQSYMKKIYEKSNQLRNCLEQREELLLQNEQLKMQIQKLLAIILNKQVSKIQQTRNGGLSKRQSKSNTERKQI